MNITAILLTAIGLAMDCFAVALGVGCSNNQHNKRYIFRMAFHFGLFQGGMTQLGWLAGKSFLPSLSSFDHWVAFGLLAFIGLRMIRAGLDKVGEQHHQLNATRGLTLVMLSLATSIDALAVGLSLALLGTNITFASLIIGLISLVLTIVGLVIGNRLGIQFGKHMEILGGIILIGIGLNILYSHIVGV